MARTVIALPTSEGVLVARIFVSHSDSDRAIADEVTSWLRTAGHRTFLDHDLLDGIAVGDDWRERLYRELRTVDAVVAVVTTSFAASSWCAAELGIADALGCRLIPLRAEAGAVHPLIADRQYADYQADAVEARARILTLCRELEFDGGSWKEGENPYPGLEPFTSSQSRVFFGRAADTREVTRKLRTARAGVVSAVVGPSGCGKSSLLNAGVLPALTTEAEWLVVDAFTPRADPLAEVARALASCGARLGLTWSAEDVRRRLDEDPHGLRRVADDLIAARGRARVQMVLAIDQGEELFTRSSEAERAKFGELLTRAMDGAVRVVTVMRSEFLDDLVDMPALAGVRVDAYVLSPLGQEMLRDIIERPARMARLQPDSDLVSRLVADTGGGEALPLLAFTLRQLAEGLRPGASLSLRRYEELGGVINALARHADEALAEAVRTTRSSARGELTEQEILVGLTHLVTIDEAGRRARRGIELSRLEARLRDAFQVFVDRRLLFSRIDDAGRSWTTVTHEALFTAWQPLESAISESASTLYAAQTIGRAAAEWIEAGRPSHHLWDADRLAAARSVLVPRAVEIDHGTASHVADLTEDSRSFLAESDARVQHYRKQARSRRTRTVVALSVLLVIALLGAAFAVLQGERARRGQDLAIARGMTAQADRVREIDPRAALQLGVAAMAFDNGPQTRAGLMQSLRSTHRFATLRGHQRAVYGLSIRKDGHLLATSGGDSSVLLWDMTDPLQPRRVGPALVDGVEAVNDVAFSPDGATLAAAHGDSEIRIWNVRDPEHPRLVAGPLEGHDSWVLGVAFSPDGRTLVSSSRDGTAILWDVVDPEHPRRLGEPLGGSDDSVRAVLSPTGNLLAVAGGTKSIDLWDVSDREHPRRVGDGVPVEANRVAFSNDGATLATADANNTISLWDVGDPSRPAIVAVPVTSEGRDGVIGVAFSPDSRTLASTHGDGTVRVWNVADRSAPWQVGQALVGHTGTALDVAFTPDGRALVTSSLDQTAVVWDLADRSVAGLLSRPLNGNTEAIRGVAFTPDNKTLLTGGVDRSVRLWDVGDRSRPVPLGSPLDTEQPGGVTDVSLSADGQLVATAGGDRSVRLWALSDTAALRPLGPPLAGQEEPVNAVAVSPDGRLLAVAGRIHQEVALWDLSDRERPRLVPRLLATRHIQTINDLAFSPDGHVLATASDDQTIRLWDVENPDAPKQLGAHLQGHADAVRAVAFSPDGRTLASGGDDLAVRLWDVSNHEAPAPHGQPLTGHVRSVNAVAFSPDGTTLATASDDQTMRLWDVRDRDLVIQLGRQLSGHTDAIYALAFSKDGRTLATASGDHTALLWQLPVLDEIPQDHYLREACRRTGLPLNASNWNQYAPGIEYRDTCA